MQKIILAAALILTAAASWAQNRNWDRPMQVKKCSMKVTADPFTATTFIEMEFYNPNDAEIEGLYRFQLQPGQVITAFQLDLNGKYRDGSIEEKWKASNAYNSIVGKRIDPALLQMDGSNMYSLRIYPIAGRNSRKITMTIQQLMKEGKETIDYYFPLSIKDVVEEFRVNIEVNNSTRAPYTKEGLLKGEGFNGAFSRYMLKKEARNFVPDSPVSFHIPLPGETVYCTMEKDGEQFFAVNYKPLVNKQYPIQPKKLTVFWDVSASGNKRDVAREISFLKQYLAYHDIQQLSIINFNHRLCDTAEFYTANGFNSRWDQYLRALSYDGATQLGCIDLSTVKSEIVFLFSDGISSYGRDLPKPGTAFVFCIASASMNYSLLDKIVGDSGGDCIDLRKVSVTEAIRSVSQARNVLMDIRSSSGKTIINGQWLDPLTGNLKVWGTCPQKTDALLFVYGNKTKMSSVDMVVLDGRKNCSASAINRMDVLHQFNSVISSGDWQKILLFGKTNKVVTTNTSYIVLERVEDYITYNITPPKELEEECDKRGFVKKDNTQLLKQASQADILQGVVNLYNNRISRWDNNAGFVTLSWADPVNGQRPADNAPDKVAKSEVGQGLPGNMNEVVVTGYSKKQAFTSSVSVIRQQDIFTGAGSLEQALSGRVAGLSITPSPGMPANITQIRIRGLSTISGNSQPLYVLDGLPVEGDVNSMISLNDIESVSILKDASATAIFGSRGSNGVILVQSKKGRNNNNYFGQTYKLKNQEDVDYLAELKASPRSGKMDLYRQLREIYGSEPGFYFDMAMHLFESGFGQDAITVLANAAEVTGGNIAVLKAMGFVLEEWKEYGEAIRIFEQVKSQTRDIQSYRNLAWAYYKNGNVQKAVDLLYEAITTNWGQQESAFLSIKSLILDDLACLVDIHKDQLDLAGINRSLIRSLPVDLRIVVDGNIPGIPGNVSILEPGGGVAMMYGNNKNLGYFSADLSGYQGLSEYQVKKARSGHYRVRVNYYSQYQKEMNIPVFVRISSYRNFGSKEQSIETQNVILDNQNGSIEIGEVKWAE